MKLLITDSVSTVSQGMDTLSNNVDTIISNVNSYDVSSADFPFSEAKAAIITNVENVKTKIKNTNVLLDAVVRVHSELQDSAGSSSEIDASSSSSSSNDNTTYTSPDTSSGSSHKDSGGKNSNGNTNLYYGGNNGGGDGADSSADNNLLFQLASTGTMTGVSSIDTSESADFEISNGDKSLLTEEAVLIDTVTEATSEEAYKELYENYKIKELSTSELATTVAKGMHIVVEGVSTDSKTFEYLKTVGTAAASYSATFEFVKLDAYASTSHGLLADAATSVDDTKEFSFKSVLGTEDDKDLSTGTASIISDSDSSLSKVQETDAIKITNEQAIKDLNKFKCAEGVKTTFTTLPITFIIKNNIVLFFKCGYLTEKELTTALASAEVIPLVN